MAVTCSMSEIYESRDFYKPIVTPYDIEMALNANCDKDLAFSYDYNNVLNETDIISGQKPDLTDVSLLTNTLRSFETDIAETSTNENQIAIKPDDTVALNTDFGAGYLSARMWKGLEQQLGQDEPALAVEGQSGIAQKYSNELNN